MLQGPDVSRPSLGNDRLHFYFTATSRRTQRTSDGTLQIKGVRFEVPSRFRNIKRFKVGFKPADLSMAYLIDPQTGDNLARIYPQDKIKNADAHRRLLEPIQQPDKPGTEDDAGKEEVPPLLRRLISEYAETGLPPAYIPKNNDSAEADYGEFDDTELF